MPILAGKRTMSASAIWRRYAFSLTIYRPFPIAVAGERSFAKKLGGQCLRSASLVRRCHPTQTLSPGVGLSLKFLDGG